MLLDDSNVTSVAEEFEDRVSVEQNPFRLIIRNLQISDEDIYLCDTTYFIPIETCDNFNGHRVELNVLVPPSEVVILDEKGDRIANGSIVGPMQERQTLKATCIVRNTRPQPQVGWWRGNKRLTTHSPSYDEKDGLFTATLELSLQLSRDDLGHSIECRTESAAIQNAIKHLFSVDLQVRPTTVTINGVEHHTVQGSKVVLTCDVHGARPPVNLTWFNASQPMNPEENDLMEIRTRAFEKEDGTYHTQSDLIFNASRFENDVKFVCQAENIVLQINREAPMKSLLTLEVLYPPVVKVSPPEITVNTSDTVLLNCEYVANPASLVQVVWYRNGEMVNVNDTQRYEGGNSENVALVIRSTNKHDIGNYTCQLSNNIGKGVSEQQIDLDVQFVPIVEVLMIPEGPVKESDESNVTLFCNILDANPSVLTKVRWYANATLLKELPDCEETREDLCHIDPSKLLLESIGRGFFYNYSCEGYNAAGWGPRSEEKELLVHYEPGPAIITHFPLVAVKKKSVTFSCTVDDPGYPETNSYKAQSSLLSSANSLPIPSIPLSLPQIHFYTIQALTASEIEEVYEALIGEYFQKQKQKQKQNQNEKQQQVQEQQIQQIQIHDHYYHHHNHQHLHYTPHHHQQTKYKRNSNHSHYRHTKNSHTNGDDDNENENENADSDDKAGHVYDDGDVNGYSLGHGWQGRHNSNDNIATVHKRKENPPVKPKHVLKETHALIDLTNNSLCTLLTLTTFSPQSQILTLLTSTTHTPTSTLHGYGHGYGNQNGNNYKNNNRYNNNNNIPTITTKNSMSSSSSPSSSSLSSLPTTPSSSSTTLSFYRKMGKFSFNARTVMPLPRYRWLRGGRGPLQDIVTKDWTVEPVGLDSRTNYSCYAFNEGGKGAMATVNLEVHAPPFFIKNLPPYTGVLHTTRNANLTCRIECVPRCEISWLKDGVAIEKNDTRYFVKDKYMDASPATGDFESMLSVLHFNMSNWPNNKFDIDTDNANYTCVSTGNTVGPGIKSATYFSIEYAPYNRTVSEEIVYVQEDTIPGRVICKSKANPEPTYEWRFNNKTVIHGNALIINNPMTRNDTGRYTCAIIHKHENSTIDTFIDVQYKPRCEIERKEIEDKDTLICTAFGNPEEADFSWSIKAENETAEWLGNGDYKAFKDKSYYELKEDYAIARTYRCVANNTAGVGTFCEIEVAEQLGWWQRWDKTTLIILVVSILILLLAVIIICCIIICICRRRRRQDKYRTDVSMSATHSILSYQPHMPQVLSADTVLPDTLKVPIIGNMLLPTVAEQCKETTATPTVIQKSIATTATSANATPIQTPTLTKHLISTSTNLQCSNSSGCSTSNNNKNNANNIEIHNAINSNTTVTITTTATTMPTPTPTPAITITQTSTIPTEKTQSVLTVATTPTHTITTPQLSVRCTQVPKSPPRWPLRPGVMVHVSSDTKENLAVNRMTLKPTTTPTNLTASTLNDSSLSSSVLNNSVTNTTQTTLLNVTGQSSTLGRIGRQARVQQNDQQDLALKVEANEQNNQQQPVSLSQTLPLRAKPVTTSIHKINLNTSTDMPTQEVSSMELAATTSHEVESINLVGASALVEATTARRPDQPTIAANATNLNTRLSSLKKVELFFSNIFFKRSSKSDGCRDSQRSHVGLLGGKFWKRSEPANVNTTKSPFNTEHRLKGIRSSGSVTYKKCAKTTATKSGSSTSSADTNTNITTATITNCSSFNNINNNNNNNNDLQISNNTELTTIKAQSQQQQLQTLAQITTQTQHQHQHQQQQQQQQHRLLASMTSALPSLNTSHPPQHVQNVQGSASVIMPSDKITTTLIQSIPSTIVSSRELKRNPSQCSQRKGILKAPTPPPRPPPIMRTTITTLKRSASHANPQKIESVQIQEKSSSMADPLTEPGEYENLPFHGLQTAPNKFTTPTTPTNFNNNTNVVHSVPRPKRLNGNISQNTDTAAATQQATYHDEDETEAQQQQYYQQQQQQQQQYSTMPYNRHIQPSANSTTSATLSGVQTLMPNSSTPASISVRNENGIIVHNSNNNSALQQQNGLNATATATATVNSNPHQITYNLSNCFPKSYTEYYQQQQQLQHPNSQQHQQFSQKFNNSGLSAASSHMISAIEHDFNTYAVVERQQNPNTMLKPTAANAATASTNPFLAVSNFKKFDNSNYEEARSGNYQTASMKRQGKRKTFAEKLEDKRFYSLKFSSNGSKQKPNNKSSTAAAALNLNHSFNGATGSGSSVGVLGSLLISSNKCKRHHSFAGGSLGDIDPKDPARNPHMNFYDPPAYENVNDAVQVHNTAVSDMELVDNMTGSAHTATVLLHPLPYGMAGGSQGPKKKHHQRQHQPKEDLNLIEPERLSIYRSDSGISNSSYECVTPIPANTQTPGSTPPPGKMPRTPKTPKTPKCHKNQTLAHTAVTAHFNSSNKKPAPRVPPTPLYMNVNEQQQQQQQQQAFNNLTNLERPTSPTSTMATSAYESASSSQNDNTCNDPISLSSTTSLYSSGGGNKSSLTAINQRCNRHQQPPEITTPEELEQYHLGHHAHAHSSSSLSVASSVSASGSNTGAAGRVKCKKQQQQQRLTTQNAIINHMELNKRKTLAHNPFLATNPAAATTATCHKKLYRRQTISDPYAHIKHIHEYRRQSNNTNIDNGSSVKTHNYGAKCPNAFKAAAAASTTTTTTDDTQSSTATCSTYKSQQQQQQQQQIGLQQHNKTRQPSSLLSYPPAATSCSQHATHHQQMLMHKNAVNSCKIAIDDNGRPYNEVVIHVADNEKNLAASNHDYQDKGDQSFNMPQGSLNCDAANNNRKQDRHANQVVKRGHNRSLSNTTNPYTSLEDNTTKIKKTSSASEYITTATLGYMERPVKLPLRKYHSFHFQPTQTVAGQQSCKLQQLKQQHLENSLELKPPVIENSLSQPYAQRGPLVFRPFKLDENVSFKPIQPSEESEDSLDYVRTYVGTVEKFLKDEEKYMDSGDFTNLTQRLRQQQTFLKSPLEKERHALNSQCERDLNEKCDTGPDSLYEDLALPTQKVAFASPSRREETQNFSHSARALSLLKTVIDNDSFPSEDERDERDKREPSDFKAKAQEEDRDLENNFKARESPKNPIGETIDDWDANSNSVNVLSNKNKQSFLYLESLSKMADPSKSENNNLQNIAKSHEKADLWPVSKLATQTLGFSCKKSLFLPLDTNENKEKCNIFEGMENVSQIPSSSDLIEKELERSALNPAASLEALEMLTKSNPELWTGNQAGSRHNLHQLELFHTLQQQNKVETTERHEDEDLGYSFCEVENDEDELDVDVQPEKSSGTPNVTVTVASSSQPKSQLKYKLTQNHGEVHI